MQRRSQKPIKLLVFILILVSLACSTSQLAAPTSTPKPKPTKTRTPTKTPKPSQTPQPTRTPDVDATQYRNELNTEVQTYYDAGYLTTTEGKFKEYDDFHEDWAQLGWYSSWKFKDTASDFYMKAHFKWSSAYRSADLSGCGFIFALQDNENGDHYAVFLDRSKVYFVVTGYYYEPFNPTHGTGRVKFDNPADHPVEADFTLIVKGTTAYVLVDEELVGEYTLSASKPLDGRLGLALLSGTNKDYGTRCTMTNLHAWIPKK
ncbi:MAG TPA: hypothetical protein VHP14_24540 [Anaerolineales bacterium]|nr:hypothetical protein [Anaerolineales bacterium]